MKNIDQRSSINSSNHAHPMGRPQESPAAKIQEKKSKKNRLIDYKDKLKVLEQDR